MTRNPGALEVNIEGERSEENRRLDAVPKTLQLTLGVQCSARKRWALFPTEHPKLDSYLLWDLLTSTLLLRSLWARFPMAALMNDVATSVVK